MSLAQKRKRIVFLCLIGVSFWNLTFSNLLIPGKLKDPDDFTYEQNTPNYDREEGSGPTYDDTHKNNYFGGRILLRRFPRSSFAQYFTPNHLSPVLPVETISHHLPQTAKTGENFVSNPTEPHPLWTVGKVSVQKTSLDVEAGYQADFGGFEEYGVQQGKVFGPAAESVLHHSAWQAMRPTVQCEGQSMTLNAGRGYTHLLVDRVDATPISLFQLPPYCGYSVRTTWRDLEMAAPYDGCYVTQENGSYVLPMLWWGSPVKIICPVQPSPPPPPSPPAVLCSYAGMAMQVQGGPGAMATLRVKVNGEAVPLVSAECSYRVDSHPDQLVLYAPFTAQCVTIGNEAHLLLMLDGLEVALSCPLYLFPLPPSPPAPPLSPGGPWWPQTPDPLTLGPPPPPPPPSTPGALEQGQIPAMPLFPHPSPSLPLYPDYLQPWVQPQAPPPGPPLPEPARPPMAPAGPVLPLEQPVGLQYPFGPYGPYYPSVPYYPPPTPAPTPDPPPIPTIPPPPPPPPPLPPQSVGPYFPSAPYYPQGPFYPPVPLYYPPTTPEPAPAPPTPTSTPAPPPEQPPSPNYPLGPYPDPAYYPFFPPVPIYYPPPAPPPGTLSPPPPTETPKLPPAPPPVGPPGPSHPVTCPPYPHVVCGYYPYPVPVYPAPLPGPAPETPPYPLTPKPEPPKTQIYDPQPPKIPIYDPQPPKIPIYDPQPPKIPIYDPQPPKIPIYDPKPPKIPIYDPQPPKIPIYDPQPPKIPIYDPQPPKIPIYDPQPPKIPIYDPQPPKPAPPKTPTWDPQPPKSHPPKTPTWVPQAPKPHPPKTPTWEPQPPKTHPPKTPTLDPQWPFQPEKETGRPAAPRPRVFCSAHQMSVELPPGPVSGIVVKDIKGGESSLQEAPKHCGYSVSQETDDRVTLNLPFTSCHMTVQGKEHRVTVVYTTASGWVGEAQLSCPTSIAAPSLECHQVPVDQRVPCGPGSLPRERCVSLGCCFSQRTAECFYPMDECTVDRHFIFSVPASLTDPPLSPAALVAAGDARCVPRKVTADYAVFKIPLEGCGTRRYEVGQTVIYLVEIVNKVQSITLNYGTITRDSPLRLLVECRYMPGSVVSVGYLVKTPSLGPALQAQGVIGVQLLIATDAQYSSYYPQYHRPLQMLLGQPLYLELRLLNPPDRQAVLLVHYCVAYPRSGHSAWVLLYNGCPNPLDPVPELQHQQQQLSRPAPRGQTRRFTIRTFQFLSHDKVTDPDEEIYFMCSTEICSPADSLCVEGCFS